MDAQTAAEKAVPLCSWMAHSQPQATMMKTDTLPVYFRASELSIRQR